MTRDHFHVGKSCGISSGGEFSPFSALPKDFYGSNELKFTRFWKGKKKLARFLWYVPADSQKLEGCPNFLLFYLSYSQIWLNLLIDDCQFGYIRKLKLLNTGEMAYNIGYTSVE